MDVLKPERKLKFCAISDLHGQLDFTIDECDYLLIAGDVCPDYGDKDQLDTAKSQLNWLCNSFVDWVIKQPIKYKCLLTWGNHDFVGQQISKTAISYLINNCANDKIVILNCESYSHYEVSEHDYLMIYGYPWTPEFCNWAFNSPKHIGQMCDLVQIPQQTSILLSHGPPIGKTGITYKDGRGIQCGGEDLTRYLTGALAPYDLRYVICGHIHGGHGQEDLFRHGRTKARNVSLLDEVYKLTHPPYYFQMIWDELTKGWVPCP